MDTRLSVSDSQLDSYILSHIEAEPDYLYRLYRESNIRLIHGHMVSGHLQGRLLKMLVHMIRPRRVLEIGTFTGYSALCMAEGLDEGGPQPGQVSVQSVRKGLVFVPAMRTYQRGPVQVYL